MPPSSYRRCLFSMVSSSMMFIFMSTITPSRFIGLVAKHPVFLSPSVLIQVIFQIVLRFVPNHHGFLKKKLLYALLQPWYEAVLSQDVMVLDIGGIKISIFPPNRTFLSLFLHRSRTLKSL